MDKTIRVTVWNENIHEIEDDEVKAVYPDGMHNVIAGFIKTENIKVQTATFHEKEHGLTEEVLENTDVLTWWSHKAQEDVHDLVVERVYKKVLDGMGLICLHSAHHSKIFRKLMGTGCSLKWREAGEKERIWNIKPSHKIAEGIPDYFELEHEEMYGEFFDIPVPDETVFISWFKGGDVFRSGLCFHRGHGRIFYFQPGHETYPTYYNKYVQKVIKNSILWVNNPQKRKLPYREELVSNHIPNPLEDI